MLPKIALQVTGHPDSDIRYQSVAPSQRRPYRPCQDEAWGFSWEDYWSAPAAVQLCYQCPFVDECLADALRADASARNGAGPAPLGVYGGVWFRPGQMPRQLNNPAAGWRTDRRDSAENVLQEAS